MSLHDLLLTKATRDQLAHFYIVESAASQAEAFDQLMKFTHEFIRDYYQKIEGAKQSMQNLMDHPDVYVMGNHPDYADKKDPNYIVEEAEQLMRFFEFKPVQGKRKFAVIPEGHKITSVVANKWLKMLEEPNANITVFLLNPRGQKLLDTIHSRAQNLRLPVSITPHSQALWDNFMAETKSTSLAQFIERNLKQDQDVLFWTNELIRWEATKLENPEDKMALSEWLKKLQEMEIFHQPSATKWTLFYAYLQAHVLPRIP